MDEVEHTKIEEKIDFPWLLYLIKQELLDFELFVFEESIKSMNEEYSETNALNFSLEGKVFDQYSF